MLAHFEYQQSIFEGTRQAELENARKQAVETYRKSDQFRIDIAPEAVQYFDSRADHICRMVASYQKADINDLVTWKKEDPYSYTARQGHPYVPYTHDDLELIKARDLREKRPVWDPPQVEEDNLHSRLNPRKYVTFGPGADDFDDFFNESGEGFDDEEGENGDDIP